MAARTMHVPATDEAEARVIAKAVADGSIGHLAHYLNPDDANRVCDHLNRVSPALHRRVFKVEVRAADDGFITNIWPADKVGDVAAVLTLFAMIPVVGLASLWERFA